MFFGEQLSFVFAAVANHLSQIVKRLIRLFATLSKVRSNDLRLTAQSTSHEKYGPTSHLETEIRFLVQEMDRMREMQKNGSSSHEA
jgi:hypothetical protein